MFRQIEKWLAILSLNLLRKRIRFRTTNIGGLERTRPLSTTSAVAHDRGGTPRPIETGSTERWDPEQFEAWIKQGCLKRQERNANDRKKRIDQRLDRIEAIRSGVAHKKLTGE